MSFTIRILILSGALLAELCLFILNSLQSVASPSLVSCRMRKMATSLASFDKPLLEVGSSSSLSLYALQILYSQCSRHMSIMSKLEIIVYRRLLFPRGFAMYNFIHSYFMTAPKSAVANENIPCVYVKDGIKYKSCIEPFWHQDENP